MTLPADGLRKGHGKGIRQEYPKGRRKEHRSSLARSGTGTAKSRVRRKSPEKRWSHDHGVRDGLVHNCSVKTATWKPGRPARMPARKSKRESV
eukprot:6212981-Pleurochrysis_carterae.AAC.4